MQRLVLDKDLNDQIEENIRKAWEEKKSEREKIDKETESNDIQTESEAGELVKGAGDEGCAGDQE